jgi:hypothetical protein
VRSRKPVNEAGVAAPIKLRQSASVSIFHHRGYAMSRCQAVQTAVVRRRDQQLRERREDVPELCEIFLAQAARELKVAPRRISADAMRPLMSYDFPEQCPRT